MISNPAGYSAVMIRVAAPAKINLFLHVGERRPDGFHELQSLIGFTEAGDQLEISPAAELSLAVTGPFAPSLPASGDNLVLKAARALRQQSHSPLGAAMVLNKNLPVSSGIGGGSADAAAALRGLDRLWGLNSSREQLLKLAAELGSDVPVCLLSKTCWVEGRGEILSQSPPLPRMPAVLVNPGVAVSTPAVFGLLNARSGTGRSRPTKALETLWDVIGYLGDAGNDLEAPACHLAPVIQEVLSAFDREPGCALAAMSGSGATCFALFHDPDFAGGAASRIAQDHPSWWVSVTSFAGPEIGEPNEE